MDDAYKTRRTLILRMKGSVEEQPWEEFLRIYRPYIQAIIRNMGIYDSDVDDLTQLVMIKLWKNISKYKKSPDQKFRSWLSTVTSNCVRDFIRVNARTTSKIEGASSDTEMASHSAVQLPDIDQIAEREWGVYITNLALERVREQFSGKAIRVFMLSLEGMDVAHIAQNMGLKENSVYRLKNRVKRQLSLEIKQLCEELE